MQNAADLTVTTGSSTTSLRLDADYGVSECDSGYHHPVLVDHGRRNAILLLSWWLPPGIADLLSGILRQSGKPGIIFFFFYQSQSSAFGYYLLHRRPAKLGDGLAIHDNIYEFFAALGQMVNAVSSLFHALQDACHAL